MIFSLQRNHLAHIALIAFVAACTVALPAISGAQVELPDVPGDFSLLISPQIPAPGEEVSARVTSYSSELSGASIRWTLNGKTIDAGVGVVTVRFRIGSSGSSNVLRVTAELPNGKVLTKTASINPAGLDLLWQSSVYKPPFYKGKAAVPYDASITLWAIPSFEASDGSRIKPESLTYTWRVNGDVLGSASGRGARSLTIPGPRVYRGVDVTVEVNSSDGKVQATRSVSFGGEQPFILFYENDPLLGFRFDRALPESVHLTRTEATISAFPYFFSATSREALSYAWTLNDTEVSPSKKSSADLVLRQTSGVSGLANVSLSIQNLVQIFQAASRQIQISFGK